jgi:signal transduction histidine kinase/ligand-binding sensor domain-containing protein
MNMIRMKAYFKSSIVLVVLLTISLTFTSPAATNAEGDETLAAPAAPSAYPGDDLRFEHLTSEDGLSSNRVLSVVRDSKGFMWFGTFDGLSRYDGYEFKVFRHDPGNADSLSANMVVRLCEDRDGFLWVGTNGGGLNRYDPRTEQFTHYRHDPTDPHSLSWDNVMALYQDREGILWIGTDGGGLNRYDPAIDGFIRYQNDPQDSHSLSHHVVWSILEDERGTLWVGTDGGGLNRFDRQSERFNVYRHDPGNSDSLGDDSVLALAEGQDGGLWIGTRSSGLDRFYPETEDGQPARFAHYRHDPDRAYSLSHNNVLDLYADEAGTLWVATGAGGLNRLDVQPGEGQSARFVRYLHDPANTRSLNHNMIASVFVDSSGLLWLATVGGGVNLADLERKPFIHYHNKPGDPNSLSSNDILKIHEDGEGVLWLGTGGGGLNRLDRQTMHYTHYVPDPNDPHSLSDNHVRAIVEDGDGILWLATRGGLNRFDPHAERFTINRASPDDPSGLLHDSIWSIHLDSEGMLWVGTSLGLNRLDPRSGQFLAYQHKPDDPGSLSGNNVNVIHEGRDGRLWFGTLGDGLNRFDRETESFVRYRHDPDDAQSLGGNTVWAMHEDAEGVLWIGTSAGLDRFDPDEGQFTHYGEGYGLPGGGVMSILEEDAGLSGQAGSNLWLSTSSGLYRFNPRTEAIRRYDAGDGLQGNEFNRSSAFKSASGELFFGGTNGVTAFYPDQIQDNPHVPQVVLTDFRLANNPVEIAEDSALQQAIAETEHLTLTHEERVISFEFAALDYRSPGKNRYRYMLEGFDEDWTEVGSDRRLVTYTNLDPGEYTFRVLGSNSDGIWNEEGASLGLTITPPWWQTPWAMGILLVFVVAGVYGAYRWRVRNLEARSRELEIQVTERTQQLHERVRELDCLYGISHLAGQQDITLEEILAGSVELIPPSWQYPEIAGACIALEDREYCTDNYAETAWRQVAPIQVRAEQAGSVEVCYLEQRPERDEGPFLKEERKLLNAVAERLGRIIERLQAEEALRSTRDELATLLALSRDVASTLELEPLLSLILDQLKGVVDYEMATIRRLEQGVLERLAYRRFFPHEAEPNQRLAVADVEILREVIQTQRATLVGDIREDQGFFRGLEAGVYNRPGLILQEARTLAVVPLLYKSQVVGVLVLAHRQPDFFDRRMVALAQAFANHSAIALVNAELYEQAGEAATLEERTRLARELHDSATQSLYSAALFSEAGKELAAVGDLESAQHYLSRVSEVVHQALKDMRLLVFELRPPVLEKEGLVGALQRRLDAVEKRAGMEARLISDALPPLPDEVVDGLYRIAQEALNNVLKHAEADAVTVTVRSGGDTVTLEVVDNGQGFDLDEARSSGGMGLVSMGERAAQLGSELTIDSPLNRGTRVKLTVVTRRVSSELSEKSL